MDIKDFKRKIVNDIAVELTDEFDRNFERKAFFSDRWPETKMTNRRGSLMVRSGMLRRSIQQPRLGKDDIQWRSEQPQASILNNGGEIAITAKMKRFFWAMYYKTSGAVTQKKNGDKSNSQRNQRLSAEAMNWKALALMKVGQKMKIEKRQFIGDHPVARKAIEKVIEDNMRILEQMIYNQLKRK